MSESGRSRVRRAVCLCGLSRDLPWCDGSHVGTGIKPRVTADPVAAAGLVLCHCGGSTEIPFCDGGRDECKGAPDPS